jgi:hypothetical protein
MYASFITDRSHTYTKMILLSSGVIEKRGNELCREKWKTIKERCMESGNFFYNRVLMGSSVLTLCCRNVHNNTRKSLHDVCD